MTYACQSEADSIHGQAVDEDTSQDQNDKAEEDLESSNDSHPHRGFKQVFAALVLRGLADIRCRHTVRLCLEFLHCAGRGNCRLECRRICAGRFLLNEQRKYLTARAGNATNMKEMGPWRQPTHHVQKEKSLCPPRAIVNVCQMAIGHCQSNEEPVRGRLAR